MEIELDEIFVLSHGPDENFQPVDMSEEILVKQFSYKN
jgi:hypothetical protein